MGDSAVIEPSIPRVTSPEERQAWGVVGKPPTISSGLTLDPNLW